MKLSELSHEERFPTLALPVALVVGLLSILPYFGLHFDFFPGDVWDNRLSNYLLEHGYKSITGQTSASFFDAPFFYPARGSLRYSENFLGSVPFYVPWRLVGFDRETSFQIWIVVGFLLNYLAAVWVLKKLRLHWFAALAGAYVFAFSQVVLTHSWHIQLHYRFAIPLAWYFLHLFLEHFRSKHLLISLSFLAWQFYCNIYEGYFLVLFLGAFVLVNLCTKPIIRTYIRNATIHSVTAQSLIGLGFAIAVAMLMKGYVTSATDPQLMAARRAEVITMLPRPISYVLSRTGSSETGWLYERLDLPMKYEHIMFVGIIPWVAVLVLLITARRVGHRPGVMAALLAMFLIMGMTLYLNGYSFYFLLMKLPGVNGIRGVTRVIMVLMLPFALATAEVIHLCRERLQNVKTAWVMAFLTIMTAGLVLENHTTAYRYPKEEARERVRKLTGQFPSKLPQDAVLAYLYPPVDDSVPYEIDAMLAAQENNISTMNGYSGAEPAGFVHLHSCADIRTMLDAVVLRNESFSIQQSASRVVALGTPVDLPCGPYLTREASNASEPLPSEAFRAGIEVTAPQSVMPGSKFLARVRVTNQSQLLWPVKGLPSGKFRLKVSCQWLTPGSLVAPVEYPNRFALPYDLRPNESESVAAVLTAPAGPGSYTIECDAVQEFVHWFHSMGSATGKTVVRVQRDPNAPAFAGFFDLVDADQIAGWAWDQDQPESPLQIEIRDGDSRLATAEANLFRKDLQDAGIGAGAHGFSIINPVRRDGRTHTIHVLVSGTNIELAGSPKLFTPSR